MRPSSEADALWATLSNANEALAVIFDSLNLLAEQQKEDYEEALWICAGSKGDQVCASFLAPMRGSTDAFSLTVDAIYWSL